MVESSTRTPDPRPEDAGPPPRTIGPFRILERIGAGGMGIVYLGERREPIEQRAALKVIRTDRLDRAYRARFAMEQTALSRMDHPNIARLLDAGDADGVSWFAMEYVPGTPLSDYCREHRLSIEARLRLFAQICDGVQHAHMKGILHRDLKPGNILVREIDGRPVAKIIDFGLAQPTDPLQIRATLHESMRQIVGTFAYMSPEQAERTEGDLDTRTDVYSLGVVLYELLTGEVPLDLEAAQRRGLAWIAEFLREHEPKKPSTRFATMGERLSSTAAERATSPHRLRSSVRGDLDWVTMKALARDRQQRYATVRELGREVERVLRHEPVEAGPPSGWYRAKKWVRRHARGVGVAAMVLLVVSFLFLANAIANEQQRAAEERRTTLARAALAIDYVEQADKELWPVISAMVPRYEAWLGDVTQLIALRNQLVELRQALTQAIETPQSSMVAAAGLRWQLTMVEKGMVGVDELAQRKPLIEARMARAATLEQRTVHVWSEAWRLVDDELRADSRFASLTVKPIPGLVPLGRNPRSDLQEFYLADNAGGSDRDTMRLPRRASDGTYEVNADTGIIFILVPGGEFLYGDEASSIRRVLNPFLISRYETTQAQWIRLAGDGWENHAIPSSGIMRLNPSSLFALVEDAPGVPKIDQPQSASPVASWSLVTWTHPVQTVSWRQVTDVLKRRGLVLPTFAQWIWAANSGSGQSLSFSWVEEGRRGAFINFRDDYAEASWRERPAPEGAPSDSWDGFVFSCPVDSMLPNQFGLHNTLGNVSELTRDGYLPDPPASVSGAEQLSADAEALGAAVEVGGSMATLWGRRAEDLTQQLPLSNVSATTGFRVVYPVHRSQ